MSTLTAPERLSRDIEQAVKKVPGTSSAYAERVIGGYYLDIVPDRDKLARYGLMVGDVQSVIGMALGGGETITTTVKGRERYGVNIRYPRDLRINPQSIASDVLPLPAGGMVPLGEVASIALTRGPTRSARRTVNSPSISTSIFETAISAGTSPMQKSCRGKGRIPARLLRDVERPI